MFYSKFEISNSKLTEKEPGIIPKLMMAADNLDLVFIARSSQATTLKGFTNVAFP